MRGLSMQLQQIMVSARGFLFTFSREYFEAIENDSELQGKYKILENTVVGMRQQLFSLAMQKQGKSKASELLKEESQQVVGLLQFSPHQAILELKAELQERSSR
jgi:CHASE3 domain sensor protein